MAGASARAYLGSMKVADQPREHEALLERLHYAERGRCMECGSRLSWLRALIDPGSFLCSRCEETRLPLEDRS